MINKHDVLRDFYDELQHFCSGHKAGAPKPLAVSPWLAAALLQKSVRRGRADWAIAAASTLLLSDPTRLWRRLAAIAFEDVGQAAPSICGLVVAALGGKRARWALGGEWQVAATLTELLVAARKCRATDDLFMATEVLPHLRTHRLSLGEMTDRELGQAVLREDDLHLRALGLTYLAGTDAFPSRYLVSRRGAGDLAFHVMEDLGVPPTIVEIAREGFRRTHETLPILLGLLLLDRDDAAGVTITDDPVEPDVMAGPVPGWAVDGYTREGRQALSRLLQSRSPFSNLVGQHVSAAERMPLAIRALFHVEGGRLIRRRRTCRSDELRRINAEEALGVPPDVAREALKLLAADLPMLNAIRTEIMEGGAHV